jgi:hypothetical protein
VDDTTDTGKQGDAIFETWNRQQNCLASTFKWWKLFNQNITDKKPWNKHSITDYKTRDNYQYIRVFRALRKVPIGEPMEKGHLGTKNQLEHRNSCWIFSEFLHFSWRFFQGETQTGMLWQHQKPAETNNFVRYIPMFASPFWRYFTTSPSSASWPKVTHTGWMRRCVLQSTAQNLASPYADTSRDLMFLEIYSVALYLLKTIEAVNISPTVCSSFFQAQAILG